MKIVVVGGSGRLGSKVVPQLVAQGHEAVPASPTTGVDAITAHDVAAMVSTIVTNPPVYDADAVWAFFTTVTRNLLAAERAAGIGHHLPVTIVGADLLPDSGYMRAKVAQEAEIEAGPIPYTILRATQFFEFVGGIVQSGTDGDTIRTSPALFQPIASDDVAASVGDVATPSSQSASSKTPSSSDTLGT